MPAELSPASPTASALSTLWAQPSKEWVIPAKPKPGRKPKEANTSATISKDDADDESSGSRRLQNRAAQRAFRERKQTQLAELQTRLHSYEQGEIERNVALQNIAKKTKEENEELLKENQILRDKIAKLERELLDKDKKRAHGNVSTPTDNSARKRVRVDEDMDEPLPPPLQSFFPSSLSPLSETPRADPLSGECNPEGQSSQSMFPTPAQVSRDILSFTTANEATSTLDQDSIDSYTCILCSPDVPCMCKAVTVQQELGDNLLHQLPVRNDNQQSMVSLEQPVHLNAPPTTCLSILDNPPAFQAPVPIRRRTGTSKANLVFPLTPMVPLPSASKCSGDPNNCIACADDNFGKAFCQAIGHTMKSSLPCIDCPQRTNRTDEIFIGGCCGDISKCGSCGIAPVVSSAVPPRGLETIPTDHAWRQLKSHPNVAFADLTLLAEVVARRSKCNGSRVVISPALGSATPDHNALLSEPQREPPDSSNESQSVLLTDPHERFHQRQRQQESPPQLVPQHVLIECGRRRVREVNADGVREALRLLDQKFAHMR